MDLWSRDVTTVDPKCHNGVFSGCPALGWYTERPRTQISQWFLGQTPQWLLDLKRSVLERGDNTAVSPDYLSVSSDDW